MKKIYTIILMIGLFVQAFALPPETSYVANIAIKASGTALDDYNYGPFPIGFSFNFYGTAYTQFYVSSNGLITFGYGSSTYTNYCLPSTGSAPDNMICAFWDDLYIDGTGAIYYQTIGAAPNRSLIVQWTNMTMFGLPTLMGTFTAILYETSNNIQIQFRSIVDPTAPQPHGSNATIGVENSGGTSAVQYSCNTNSVTTGTALLFTRSGATYTLNSNATYQGVLLVETTPYPGIPGLVSPANDATVGLSTNFQWTAATDATSYSLQLSANSDLSSRTAYPAGTATNYTPPDFATGVTQYWSVWATNSSGTTWSEIRKFTTSANPPLAAVPQIYYVELTQDIPIQISYTGGDASAKTAIITSLPTDGALYQYNSGVRGAQITSVPTTLTDASMRLIYAATGTSGNSKGNFSIKVHDGTGDSPVVTTTVNVSPLGAPNFLRAAKSTNTIEIQFDKLMADPTGKQAQFTVTDGSGAVSVTSAALKTGDSYTIVLTLGRTLTGTVNLAYTAGTIASQIGGLLLSFSAQIVALTSQTISFGALAAKNIGDAAFSLTATASSGLAVTYASSNTSVASISGSTCTLTGAGSTTITATQAGNGTYAPATYSQILTVNPKILTVTGATVTSKAYDGTASATITGATLSGVSGSDVVTLNNATSGTFASTNVGTGITVTTSMTITGANAGNYSLTQPTLTGNITAKVLTVTGATVTSKAYDGNTSAVISGATLAGVLGSDVVTLGAATSGTFASTSVGTGKTVTTSMTISGANAGNYTLTQPTLTGTITAKALTVTGSAVTSKIYDGNTAATITGATLNGVVGSDVATLATATSGIFASASVGTGKTVTSAMTLTGASAGNYTITQPTLTGNITAKALTVTGASGVNKVYDGNTAASITGASLSGVIGSDVVTLATATSGIFASGNVGSGISITPAMTITGAASGNYTLTQPVLTANITTKAITATGASAVNKVYDGTPAATITGGTLNGVIGSDVVTLATATSGIFASASVGNGKTVTSAMTLTGANANNYTVTQPTLTANITAKTLTVTGATGVNKVYDGTTAATITGAALSGVVGSDVVTLAGATSGTFASAIVGNGKTVTSAMTLTGAAAGNYSITQPTLTANITTKTLTVTGASGVNKAYDGTTAATITGANLNGVMGADAVILTNATSGIFASANVGTGINIALSMAITGAASGNYTLTQPILAADITTKALTITGAMAANKVYDGSTATSISGATLNGIVGSEDVSLQDATSGIFADANVGSAKAVTTAMSLTGTDISNYALSGQPSLTANITAQSLTITGATVSNKVYDGTTSATISDAVLTGIIGSDDVSLQDATAGNFDDANVGTAKTVTTAMSLTGTASGNYTLAGQISLNADITAQSLAITGATADNKVYDATTSATISGAALNGVVGGDDVSLQDATAGNFDDANVGTAKTVTTAMSLTGSASGNYILSGQPSLTANITAKDLTVIGATADNKVYNGSISATISGATLSGIIGSDDVSLQDATAGSFADANVGTSKTVTSTMSLTGAASGNYALPDQPLLNADITVQTLTITGATAANKVYDATTSAAISDATLSGVVGSDDVSLQDATSGNFIDANVGSAKTITTTMSLTGTASGNYTLSGQPSLTADITAKELTVTGASAANKNYDRTTTATVSGGSLVGVVGTEDVALDNTTSGTFVTASSGTNISVITAMTLTGSNAGNYKLTQPTLSADIIGITLTVTGATADNKVYDGTTMATISGGSLVGIIDPDVVTLGASPSGTFASANVGTGISVTPALTLSGIDASGYMIIQPILAADITAKALTVKANDASKSYGDTNPELTVSYNGFANSESAASLTTAPMANTTATQFSDATTYSIVPNGGVAANYTFIYVNGTLTVNKTQLEVTAKDTSRKQGNPNPEFTLLYSGFKGNDSYSVIDVLPTASCTAVPLSDIGNYDIVLTGGSDNNYNLVSHNGKLTVTSTTAISPANTLAISISPNPASDYFYIHNLPEKTTIHIINIQGVIVKSSISTSTPEKIDVQDLPAGVYLIKLSGNEINTVVRIVKL
jgi:hypothetical protein